ncbi:MAG: DUF971 domain-containing protein [Phycisphaerales bacterium]|nr:DUF971 domain-containing protein [Phycisphaerales bacterium]MCI0676594.1 DUF971 domain-containing protein [Phycisphaerales bacterium]
MNRLAIVVTRYNSPIDPHPLHLDLEKERGLTIQWSDGAASFFPVAYLRRMSPSADARTLREQLAANPLTVLPHTSAAGPLIATNAEFVGNYAIRITFSDGHDTGLFSWKYLRQIDPSLAQSQAQPTRAPTR